MGASWISDTRVSTEYLQVFYSASDRVIDVVLYEFYGDGCPHCEKMAPKVDSLEENHGVEVKQLEVWNNEENAEKLQEYDDGKCGGVPFFYNTETEEFICGETDMENLREWAGASQGGEA